MRAFARSRWAQFNEKPLTAKLKANGIGYEHLPECGGKIVVPTHELERGIERILELAGDARIALMCSESQPLTKHKQPQANCHRVGLLAPPLKRIGCRIMHIMPDGEIIELDEADIPSIWNADGV